MKPVLRLLGVLVPVFLATAGTMPLHAHADGPARTASTSTSVELVPSGGGGGLTTASTINCTMTLTASSQGVSSSYYGHTVCDTVLFMSTAMEGRSAVSTMSTDHSSTECTATTSDCEMFAEIYYVPDFVPQSFDFQGDLFAPTGYSWTTWDPNQCYVTGQDLHCDLHTAIDVLAGL